MRRGELLDHADAVDDGVGLDALDEAPHVVEVGGVEAFDHALVVEERRGGPPAHGHARVEALARRGPDLMAEHPPAAEDENEHALHRIRP